VLTERREHLERLAHLLTDSGHRPIILHGDMRPAQYRAAQEQLASSDDDRRHVVLATGRYIGEGFDDPRLDTLLLAMPIAWRGTVIQYAGRLHRVHPGKRDVLIYDYVDAELSVLRRMFTKRLRTYRSLRYELAEARPLHQQIPRDSSPGLSATRSRPGADASGGAPRRAGAHARSHALRTSSATASASR